jgi:hypothetical protein
MTPPPIIPNAQAKKDDEHLRLLSVFHFVFAGLALLGIAFLWLHYFIMSAVFTNPELWKSQGKATPPPAEFLGFLKWVYVVLGVLMVAAGVANLFSALFLRRRQHRMFSLIIGGLNCLQIPFGTALGVFTLMVLMRNSVRESYEAPRAFP